jgi:NitT/TauT family transport system permease protein
MYKKSSVQNTSFTNVEFENTEVRPKIRMKKLKDFGDGNKKLHNTLLICSIFLGPLVWYVITLFDKPAMILSTPAAVWKITMRRIQNGYYFPDIWASLNRVLTGYAIGMACAIPMGFLMGWYKTIRSLTEAWIQFIRTIPPIATIPIMVVAFGVGENSKVAIIFLAVFLSSSITIYQGIKETDKTLIKAAYTFGASDKDIFLHVTLPSAFPYILVAARDSLAGSFTTLIAAEMTGASIGLGARIQIASGAARIDIVMMGILTIGILGFFFDRLILVVEKKLTRWK